MFINVIQNHKINIYIICNYIIVKNITVLLNDVIMLY